MVGKHAEPAELLRLDALAAEDGHDPERLPLEDERLPRKALDELLFRPIGL